MWLEPFPGASPLGGCGNISHRTFLWCPISCCLMVFLGIEELSVPEKSLSRYFSYWLSHKMYNVGIAQRYCILWYYNINTNVQRLYSACRQQVFVGCRGSSYVHVLWKVTRVTLKTTLTSLAIQGGVSSQAGKVILHFLITSKVNNCRSEKRCVFFCEHLLMLSVEIKPYIC